MGYLPVLLQGPAEQRRPAGGRASEMILFPAIDLKDGQAVRLLRGEMASATVFNDDPAAQARAFAEAGFRWLHLVDLNGAFAGRPANAAAVEAILRSVERRVGNECVSPCRSRWSRYLQKKNK